MADSSSTLQGLLAETGLTAGPRVVEFTQLATAVQRARRRISASSSDTITRSTALWTLMELGGDIKQALETNGLDAAAFGTELSIGGSPLPPPIDVDVAELHDYLASALQTYLATAEVRGRPFDLPDLAAAIMIAARDDPRGELRGRLASLDIEGALAGMQRLTVAALDITPRVASDLPAIEDRLGFGPLVAGLYELINHAGTRLPLAIAITAPWGAGKSSAMLQLREALGTAPDSGEAERSWYTVAFEAWKYERTERLWAALALAIYDEPQRAMSRRTRMAFRFRLDRERHRRNHEARASALHTILYVVRLIAPVLGGVGALVAIAVIVGTSDVLTADWGKAVVVATAGVTAGLATARTIWRLVSDPFRRTLTSYANRPDYGEQLGFTSTADRDIRCLTKALTAEPNRGVAVFVDDLDRVAPANVVEIVGAINQVFNSDIERRCVFVLGMDREIVAAGIEVAYRDTIQRLRERKSPLARDFGAQFLSKIVQLSVAIPAPTPTALKTLLADVTGNPPPGQEAEPDLDPSKVRQFERELEAQGPSSPVDVTDAARAIAPGTAEAPADRRALDEAVRRARARRFTADSPDVAAAEFEVLKYLARNPRELKRFDNAFRLQLHVANSTNDGSLDFRRPQLVALGKWVALRLRWPGLAAAIDADPSLLEALERSANGEATPDDTGERSANGEATPDDTGERSANGEATPDDTGERSANGEATPDDTGDGRQTDWLADDALRLVLAEDDDRRRISALQLTTFLRVS